MSLSEIKSAVAILTEIYPRAGLRGLLEILQGWGWSLEEAVENANAEEEERW